MIAYFILAFFSFIVGIQICKNDFKLIFSYNYKIHFSTCITFIASAIALVEMFSFAVGIFMGVISGAGMVEAMAEAIVNALP